MVKEYIFISTEQFKDAGTTFKSIKSLLNWLGINKIHIFHHRLR